MQTPLGDSCFLAALLLGAVIGVVSLLGRPSGTETPENTAAPC